MGILAALGFGGTKGVSIPGGGTVTVPAPYQQRTTPATRSDDGRALIAYRKLHSTMAGTTECNGMIAIALPSEVATLGDLVATGRANLTTRWAFANESEGRWYGKPETWAEVAKQGQNGEERIGPLKVHTVGWTVYDDPACLYAVNDRRGVMIAVWILNRHGGEKRARRYAERIAASFTA
jgi:hypothetical protein